MNWTRALLARPKARERQNIPLFVMMRLYERAPRIAFFLLSFGQGAAKG